MSTESHTVDIRPESDIYETYRRLSYLAWYAVAEFVDNATESFYRHQEDLEHSGSPTLSIHIFYDRDVGTMDIVDDAYGMGLDDFKRALQLAKPPSYSGGRSEFGMGLKTAACWMGPKWTVASKQLGSTQEFSAVVDVTSLKADKPTSIEITEQNGLAEGTHYTRIGIEGLTDYDRTFVGRTLGKIKSELASIYRRDLMSGTVKITFNGEELTWSQPALLTEQNDDETTVWRKDLSFEIHGKEVRGWIGVLAKGRAADAGFHLFRRGRLIDGGPSQGWKPWEVFGAPNTFQSQRLIGELDLDAWRVSHTKDRIDMSGEDAHELVEELKSASADYIAKAREHRRSEGKPKLSRAAVENVVEETKEELEDSDTLGARLSIIEEGHIPPGNPDETALLDEVLEETDAIEINFGGAAFPTLKLALSDTAHGSEPLVRVGFPGDRDMTMLVNLNHPFIGEFVGDNERAMKVLVHMMYADALTERVSRKNPDLAPDQLRQVKDSFLRELTPLD